MNISVISLCFQLLYGEAAQSERTSPRSEPDYFSVSGNQVKTDTVQAAFDLCGYYSGPPLVTTPGSDFAVLCSLLYELLSGETEGSLAGAINKFSRSKAR